MSKGNTPAKTPDSENVEMVTVKCPVDASGEYWATWCWVAQTDGSWEAFTLVTETNGSLWWTYQGDGVRARNEDAVWGCVQLVRNMRKFMG